MTSVRSALVTGAAGQDGILLSEFLVSEGYRVWCFVREDSTRLAMLRERVSSVQVIHGDLRDRSAVAAALEIAQPDEVYNLAGFSSVARSWAGAHEVMQTNALAIVGLLDEIRAQRDGTGRDVRFYQASSSEMFGTPLESPQTEVTAFHPRSPYGVAKTAAHFLTMNYRESYDLFGCSGILYNHESTLREPHFVTRKITSGVAAIATGHARQIRLGTLDVNRDWGYAPDYVRAMWLMLQHDEPDDYIVATGRSHSLREFLTLAFACVGVDDWSDMVTYDVGLLRPAETAGLVGDATKARATLGWAPTIGLGEIVARMVDYDLALAAK